MKIKRARNRFTQRGAEAVGHVRGARRTLKRRVLAQKGRQRQEPVPPRFAGRQADRPARLRRDIGEIVRGPCRGAAPKVEGEAAFRENPPLEQGDERRGERGVVEPFDDDRQRLVDRLVGVALGQKTRELGEPGEARKRERAFHEPPGAKLERFDRESAEVLVEPGAPDEREGVARLEGGGHAG